MTKFYSPVSKVVSVDGQTIAVTRGIHEVPDVLANNHLANELGIKPVEEMTDAEYVALGLTPPPPPEPVHHHAAQEAPAGDHPAAGQPVVISGVLERR